MDVMVHGSKSAQVAGMLYEREIPFSVALRDVANLMQGEQSTTEKEPSEPSAPHDAEQFMSRFLYDHGYATEPDKILDKGHKIIPHIVVDDNDGIHILSTDKTRLGDPSRRLKLPSGPTMDWTRYHNLETIYAFMNNLAAEYPYLCTISVIGRTTEGRDMLMLKISNGVAGNTAVWMDGAIHPREWVSAAAVTYIADRLVRTFNSLPDSVTTKDWYILPVMNPDGYEYTHTTDRMWRKNRARYGECVGVDLNRNFSYGFGENGEEGSSADPGSVFYRGPSAFSEPETIAVKHMIQDSTANFKVFLSFHSYGEVVIFPWGYTADPCSNYVDLLEGGTVMAKAIFETSGRTYKVGSTKDLMYYAAGCSTDWSYGAANIPYSYMVELRCKKHRFLLPKEEIIPTAKEVYNGVIKLIEYVDKKLKKNATPKS